MNSIQASRIINNFITDLKLNNDFLIRIQDILNNCSDINGTEFFTCLYLYDNDIIYISQREYNPYNINELIQILKNNLPNIKGIFYVDYSHNDNKTTIRLARKLI